MTGKQLKQARMGLQLTQKGLAEALDLSKNHVAMMERDELPIRRVTEFAIRYLLGVSKPKEKTKQK